MFKKKIYIGKSRDHKDGKKNEFLGYVWAILVVLVIHVFFYQPYTIPSGSMMPTLLIGDYLLVNKFAYGYSKYSVFFQPEFIRGRIKLGKPDRGEVAVFFHEFKFKGEENIYDHGIWGGKLQKIWRKIRKSIAAPQKGVNYVKRVIGLPGDRIQMIEGQLFINGEKTELNLVGEYPLEEGTFRIAKLYQEKLPNGKIHPILKTFEFGKASLDNTKEFVIPEGHYFMMGDNRDNSCDSREFNQVGFIPEGKLIGRPDLIFFSTTAKFYEIHKWLFALRYKRLFKIIR